MANLGSGNFKTLKVTNDNNFSIDFNQSGDYRGILKATTITSSGSINLDADAASHFNTSTGNLGFDAESGCINIDGGNSIKSAINIKASSTSGGIILTSGTNGITATTSGDVTITSSGADINLGTPDDDFSILNASNLTRNIQMEATGTISMNSEDVQVVSSDTINFISQTGDIKFGTSITSPSLKFVGSNVLVNSSNTSGTRTLEVGVSSNSSDKTGYNGILVHSFTDSISPEMSFSNNDSLGILELGVESSDSKYSIQDTRLAFQEGSTIIKVSGDDFSSSDIGKKVYWSRNNTTDTIQSIVKSIRAASLISNASLTTSHILTTSGTYTGSNTRTYKIEIDSVNAVVDTFKWSNDGGKTFQDTYIPIDTSSSSSLEDGITITFARYGGYTLGDYWTFTVTVGVTVSSSTSITTLQDLYVLKPNISYMINKTPSDMKLGTSGHERLRLTAEGNMGLNVTNPLSTFQVNSKVGEASIVNTYISGYQLNPSVAGLVNGGYVIVWESAAQDGSQYGIYGQLFYADGSKNGNEFKVNVTTNYYQSFPHVSALLDKTKGGFMVVWSSEESSGSGTYDIKGQIYDETKVDGSRALRSYDLTLNTTTTYTQKYPRIAGLTGSNYIVVWESDDSGTGNMNIYGQLISYIGNFVGTETRVNATTTYSQNYPYVAAISADDTNVAGGFVVAFMSEYSDDGLYDVKFRVFDSSFTAQSVGDISVTSNTYLSAGLVSVVGLDAGGLVIAFYENYEGQASTFGNDTSVTGVTSGASGNIATRSGNTLTLSSVSGTFSEDEEIYGNLSSKREKIATVSHNGTDATITLSTDYKKVTAYKYATNSSSYTYSISTVNTTSMIEDAERKALSATNFIRDNTIFTYKRPMAHISNLNDGNIVITWTNGEIPSIYYQKFYASNGTAIGTETQVESVYSGLKQRNQMVSRIKNKERTDSGFCITWDAESLDMSKSGIRQIKLDDDNFLFRAKNGFSNTVITHSGNMGIGTTSPSTALHVENSSPYITLRNTNTAVGPGISDGKLIFENSNGTKLAEIKGCYSSSYEQKNPQQTYLKAWCKLNESSGNSTADSTGNGNTGTLYNFNLKKCWVEAKINNGLEFDGVDDYVNLGKASAISGIGNASFTISAWVKLSQNVIVNSTYDIISNSGASSAGTYILTLDDTSSDQVMKVVGSIYTSSGAQTVTGSDTINDGSWHNLVFVLNTSDTTIKVYVDGSLDSSASYSGSLSSLSPANYVYLGSKDKTTNFFRGVMDDVRIYNVAFSSSNVQTLYNNGSQTRGKIILKANDGSDSLDDIKGLTVDDKGQLESAGIVGLPPSLLTGNLTSNASTYVVGTGGTLFLSELRVGDRISINNEKPTVTSITSDTLLNVGNTMTSSSTDTSVERLPFMLATKDSDDNLKLVLDSDGDMGIGESNPNTKLHVSGTGDTNDKPYITLTNTTTENTSGGRETRILFDSTSGSEHTLAQIETSHDGNSSDTKGKMRFYTHTGSSLERAMIINSSGYVGIGSDVTPLGLLHIKSDTSENCNMIFSSNISGESVFGGRSNIYFQGVTAASGHTGLDVESFGKITGSSNSHTDNLDGRLDLYVNNDNDQKLIPHMSIVHTGRVGITINEPQNPFQVGPQQYPSVNSSNPNFDYESATASQSGTTVTASESAFTSVMVGSIIVYNDSKNTASKITSYSSGTSVSVADSNTISAGTKFKVFYPGLNVNYTGKVGINTINPNTHLHVEGPISTAITSTTSTYTCGDDDSTVLVDASSGGVTVNLPSTSGITGRIYTIKKTDSSGNVVTVDGNASTVDGIYESNLESQYKYITVQTDGSNWHIISDN